MAVVVNALLRVWQRVVEVWLSTQVELHGKYSMERVRRLHAFSTRTPWYQLLAWAVMTPLPCLVLNTIMDFAPLANPSEGREANYVFWVRCYITSFAMLYGIYSQIGFLTPGLGMTISHAFWASFVIAFGQAGFTYFIAGFIPFPVPFTFVAGIAPFLSSSSIFFLSMYGKKLRNDRTLLWKFFKANAVIVSQLSLTFIYPIFIFGFNNVPSKYKGPYMILLPIIKITAKNSISKLVGDNDDLKPETVIFNVEIFNALYVSLAMQSATSVWASLLLFAIDFLQAWASMHDVIRGFRPVQILLSKLPPDHPLKSIGFIQAAVVLADTENDKKLTRSRASSQSLNTEVAGKNYLGPRKSEISITTLLMSSIVPQNKVHVIPAIQPNISKKPAGESSKSLAASASVAPSTKCGELTASERAEFIRAARHLLFTIEFIVLIEYTEIIIPIFYSVYMYALYFLPNRAYFPAIAYISEPQLRLKIANVLGYAALEIVSFIGHIIVLRRIVGVSAMRMLGFVLKLQWKLVQSKLLIWIFYSMQTSLDHFGADFTFQFKWLRSQGHQG